MTPLISILYLLRYAVSPKFADRVTFNHFRYSRAGRTARILWQGIR